MRYAFCFIVLFTLALLGASKPINAQTLVGQQIPTPVYEETALGTSGQHQFKYVGPTNYTVTQQIGKATISDAIGTPMAINEPWHSQDPKILRQINLAAGGTIGFALPGTCGWWDIVHTPSITGNANTPSLSFAGKNGQDPSSLTILIREFNPATQQWTKPEILSLSVVQSNGGQLVLHEIYNMPGMNNSLTQFGDAAFYQTGGPGLDVNGKAITYWKPRPIFFTAPMTGTRFHGIVSLEVLFHVSEFAESGTAFLVGYTSIMPKMPGMNCGVIPPPPPDKPTTSTFLAAAKFLCSWGCITNNCHNNTRKLMIRFPYENQFSDAMDRIWLVKQYLQDQQRPLIAEYVALQVQIELFATPANFYNADLLHLTRGKFNTPFRLNDQTWVYPTDTLRPTLSRIHQFIGFGGSTLEGEFYLRLLQLINWDASGLGSGPDRKPLTATQRNSIAARDSDRAIADDETISTNLEADPNQNSFGLRLQTENESEIGAVASSVISHGTTPVSTETISIPSEVRDIRSEELPVTAPSHPYDPRGWGPLYSATATFIATGNWDGVTYSTPVTKAQQHDTASATVSHPETPLVAIRANKNTRVTTKDLKAATTTMPARITGEDQGVQIEPGKGRNMTANRFIKVRDKHQENQKSKLRRVLCKRHHRYELRK